jgi:hypothetical protein
MSDEVWFNASTADDPPPPDWLANAVQALPESLTSYNAQIMALIGIGYAVRDAAEQMRRLAAILEEKP